MHADTQIFRKRHEGAHEGWQQSIRLALALAYIAFFTMLFCMAVKEVAAQQWGDEAVAFWSDAPPKNADFSKNCSSVSVSRNPLLQHANAPLLQLFK